ncbi:neutral zinc metallopeptidase [Sphingomonas sp.]|uniref:KPN_02809 family neutral zinc metallopeptidase n=1 Tax=Sphingomonas sp. TaxID=28214 RepID=UPI00286DB358|nr:neutral zinc metallopeptidase [Sphingomonas sp.]
MRLGDEDPSGNFIDNTGRGGFGLGGGGGNMLGCLLPLVASRFGIIGVLVLLVGYCALNSLGGGGGLLPTGGGPTTSAPAGQSTLDPNTKDVLARVLGSTERRWTDLFARSGARYTPTKMIAYSNSGQSGCGTAQAAMGPFYCPTDQSIYLDPTFFNELSTRFGAPGDFAMAYVVAHEVGHHVQNLEGTLDRAQQAQSGASRTGGNQIQVGVELQADCYAGVWAANDKNLLEPGDLEEGMRAAEAIGDDTLQKQTQGRVVPESFTHGTSAQRMAALQTGLKSGDPAACKFN